MKQVIRHTDCYRKKRDRSVSLTKAIGYFIEITALRSVGTGAAEEKKNNRNNQMNFKMRFITIIKEA